MQHVLKRHVGLRRRRVLQERPLPWQPGLQARRHLVRNDVLDGRLVRVLRGQRADVRRVHVSEQHRHVRQRE